MAHSTMQNVDPEPIAVLYLTHLKNGLFGPKIRSSKHPSVLIDSNGPSPRTSSLKISLPLPASVRQPVCLIIIGTDPEKCTIVLAAASGISPVHCKVYFQPNTTDNVWLLEDCSDKGTAYCDDRALIQKEHHVLCGERKALIGLHAIEIGPYRFACQLPKCDVEIAKLCNFFRRNEPIPVTERMLSEQLGGTEHRFRRLELLGKGACGKVFKAMEEHTGLLVAIKEQTIKDKNGVRREMDSMTKLNHDGLVKCIFALSEVRNGHTTCIIGMPLFQGTLEDALPLGDITVVERAMIQLVEALIYVHEQGFCHRDIKPANIFIASKTNLTVVLGDLGFATNASKPNTVCGSPGYDAPEVIKGLEQTSAMDVYSLGVTFFEMVEDGRGRIISLRARVLNIVGQPPRYYGQLIAKMTAYNPSRRPHLTECLHALKMTYRSGTPEPKQTPRALAPLFTQDPNVAPPRCRPIQGTQKHNDSIFCDKGLHSPTTTVPKFNFIEKARPALKQRDTVKSMRHQPRDMATSHKALARAKVDKSCRCLSQVNPSGVVKGGKRACRSNPSSLVLKCALAYNRFKHVRRCVMSFFREVKLTAQHLEQLSDMSRFHSMGHAHASVRDRPVA